MAYNIEDLVQAVMNKAQKNIMINELQAGFDRFAYDNCHKFYIIEDREDEKQFTDYGYDIYSIDDLPDAWEDACSLKFISNAKLTKEYIPQGA